MHRTLPVVLAAAILSLAVPGTSSADSYAYGSDQDEEDSFGWAIISGENTSMSDMRDLDSMDDLKDRFGDEFLYIRDGKDRYVISDPGMVERALEASQQIRKYGKEMGKLARAQARIAVDESLQSWGGRGDRLSASEKKELRRRSDEASKRLQQGVRRVQRDMHEILKAAKSRGLAERLDR
jgi:hypothetical protein